MNRARGKNFLPAGYFRGEDGRLRHRRGPVVHGRIGDFRAGEMSNHRLVFINRLQDALADFRLIRGVGCVKFSPSDNVPHDWRDKMSVGARAGQRDGREDIAGGNGLQKLKRLLLRQR